MNKRASVMFGSDMVLWIFRIGILVIMAVLLAVFASLILKTTVDIRVAETELIVNSILYSPSGIVYSENSRSYPGIIDFGRFKQSVVDSAFYSVPSHLSDRQYWAYNLTLFNSSMGTISSIIGNSDWYLRWCVLAGTGLPGSGSAIRVIDNFYVQIKYPDRTEFGFLRVDIVRPRT